MTIGTLGSYVFASLLLGLAPLVQADGGTFFDFFDATGATNLLHSGVGAVLLLANGHFWMQALRCLSSAAALLSAVAAIRYLAAVQRVHPRPAPAGVNQAAPVAANASR